jgi:transketolase
MAAISRASISLCGSHAGVSIGEDGPSQMGLEDISMMRAVHGSTVLYPSDATSAAHLTAMMADLPGISFLRTTRASTPVLYGPDELFPVGGSKVVRRSDADVVTVVGAGITLHEVLKAYDQLANEGIAVRVVDAYSVKPIDAETLQQAAQDTGGKLVVVEDHRPEGGLGDAVLDVFTRARGPLPTVVKLGVRFMPGSGEPAQLMHAAGIDAVHIVQAVNELIDHNTAHPRPSRGSGRGRRQDESTGAGARSESQTAKARSQSSVARAKPSRTDEHRRRAAR